VLVVIGITSVVRMPVDLFPAIKLPEVVVATFYSGINSGLTVSVVLTVYIVLAAYVVYKRAKGTRE
jgi:multidrug efflux pump subunit AcrB